VLSGVGKVLRRRKVENIFPDLDINLEIITK
jgi:hypothetical protein